MNRTQTERPAASRDAGPQSKDFVLGFHGVRYQVKDVARSVEFYTRQLGFELVHQQLPAFASVSIENLTLLLKNLTPARWKLLEALKRSGPMSINELARQLARNYKNVHTDVTRLVELGLIERGKDQRVAVAWDTITAEMRLAA